MLQRIKKIIHRATASPGSRALSRRRFEAAETNRLNKSQWQRAVVETNINSDLLTDLAILRTRLAYELKRNPILCGIVKDFGNDVAGEDGPILRVKTKNSAYKLALQSLWWKWFNSPEISGKLTGADMIRLWVGRLLDSGEFLAQRVTKKNNPGPVAFRLKLLHPRRLGTPPGNAADPNIVMGVKRSDDGEPLTYFISQPQQFGAFTIEVGQYVPLDAKDIIHEFITIEEDQARGYPWLTQSLPVTADLRDLDAEVLDAVRAAADQAIVWYTDHPDSTFLEADAVVDIERRTQQTGPPGWKPMQMTPEQPGVNHVDYRQDRLRELGRPIGMPLMKIRLGSEEHNFASARFDNEIYKNGVKCLRRWIERRTLYSFVDEVKREGQLTALANPEWKYAALANPPDDLDYAFVWQPMVAVDADKDSQDEERRLGSGTLTFEDACAKQGLEQEQVIESTAETIRLFKKAGITVLPAWAENWADPAIRQFLQQKIVEQQKPKDINGNARHTRIDQ